MSEILSRDDESEIRRAIHRTTGPDVPFVVIVWKDGGCHVFVNGEHPSLCPTILAEAYSMLGEAILAKGGKPDHVVAVEPLPPQERN